MDALDTAITSLDVTGPLTTEHLAQLLRGLAKTITGKFDLLLAKKYSEFKGPETCLTIHAMVFGRNRCAIQFFVCLLFSLHERGQHCLLLLYSFLFYFLFCFVLSFFLITH